MQGTRVTVSQAEQPKFSIQVGHKMADRDHWAFLVYGIVALILDFTIFSLLEYHGFDNL